MGATIRSIEYEMLMMLYEYDRFYRQKGDDRITNCVLQPPTGKGAAAANYAMEAIKSCQVIKIMSLLWWKSDEKWCDTHWKSEMRFWDRLGMSVCFLYRNLLIPVLFTSKFCSLGRVYHKVAKIQPTETDSINQQKPTVWRILTTDRQWQIFRGNEINPHTYELFAQISGNEPLTYEIFVDTCMKYSA